MLRGTRIIEAKDFNRVVAVCKEVSESHGYTELIIPSIWEQQTFVSKAGTEILGQMYAWNEHGRDICLIPEVTAIIQEQWKGWAKEKPKPYRVSYLSRCYRYERPQAGRYREFWQWGCEMLGGHRSEDGREISRLLIETLHRIGLSDFVFNTGVKRGLDYYVENGFEVACERLGAQKQVAGGGRYEGGIGFAIGIDRAVMALGQADA